jgi:hypothetical protein
MPNTRQTRLWQHSRMVMITMIGLVVVLGTALIINREKLDRPQKINSYAAESQSQAGKEAPVGRDCVRLLDIGFSIRLLAKARAMPHPDPSAEELEGKQRVAAAHSRSHPGSGGGGGEELSPVYRLCQIPGC